MTSQTIKIGSFAENAASNISDRDEETWTLLFYFGKRIISDSTKNEEIIIKVIVVPNNARTKSFQVDINNFCIFVW